MMTRENSILSVRSMTSVVSARKKPEVPRECDTGNVHKALKLMRKVDIPPIRTEHDYSKRKMFGEVSNIPLQKLADIEKSAHVSLHERRIKVSD